MVAIEEAGCCELSKRRVTEGNLKPGALWHIFDPHDSNKIRELLRKVSQVYCMSLVISQPGFLKHGCQYNIIYAWCIFQSVTPFNLFKRKSVAKVLF